MVHCSQPPPDSQAIFTKPMRRSFNGSVRAWRSSSKLGGRRGVVVMRVRGVVVWVCGVMAGGLLWAGPGGWGVRLVPGPAGPG